jgi:flagellar biosynthesis protein FlhF
LETKRFIGNDMARIFARVRRELGPEAVIVQTRSLLRDGGDPLIEVLASATAGGDDALTLALQKVLVQGSLDRAEAPAGRGITVGDLEDIATRERGESAAAREFERQYAAQAPAPQPEWLQGFVSTSNDQREDELPPHLAQLLYEDDEPMFEALSAALPPFATPQVLPPEPIEWSPRPRILTRKDAPVQAPREPDREAPAARNERRFAPVEPGLAGRLLAAGFSAEAARRIADAAPNTDDPAAALEATLAAGRIEYPVDNRTAIVTIQGAPGSGRTTALMRMALDCADSGREAILVAADSSHTGGRAQIHGYGEAIGLPVFDAFAPKDLVAAITKAPKGACVFVDVPAGRWAPPPIPGVQHFVYIAVPAHWQPSALEAELAEFDVEHCAGAVVTGTDIATGLTPALSLLVESRLGVAFLSSGRDVGTGITVADPFTLASGVFTTSTRETTNGRLAVTA